MQALISLGCKLSSNASLKFLLFYFYTVDTITYQKSSSGTDTIKSEEEQVIIDLLHSRNRNAGMRTRMLPVKFSDGHI